MLSKRLGQRHKCRGYENGFTPGNFVAERRRCWAE
jgi:hypothetical protein